MTVRFYGKAESAAKAIVAAFQKPQELPKALAPIFIRRKDAAPCRSWSWANQLIVAVHGHADARGFRQWGEVGRHVKAGQHGFPILCPCLRKRERTNDETGETTEQLAIVGFRHAVVFGFSQTDGEPLPGPDPAVAEWLESLPVMEVARNWGLSVDCYNGQQAGALGRYWRGRAIALGVKNLSTWAHEMIHAADHRLGSLTEVAQHWRSETVAELGASVLLTVLGFEHDADLGGCWDYVSAYARDAKVEPIVACQRVLKRTCDAVALILDTAESLRADDPVESAQPATPVAVA